MLKYSELNISINSKMIKSLISIQNCVDKKKMMKRGGAPAAAAEAGATTGAPAEAKAAAGEPAEAPAAAKAAAAAEGAGKGATAAEGAGKGATAEAPAAKEGEPATAAAEGPAKEGAAKKGAEGEPATAAAEGPAKEGAAKKGAEGEAKEGEPATAAAEGPAKEGTEGEAKEGPAKEGTEGEAKEGEAKEGEPAAAAAEGEGEGAGKGAEGEGAEGAEGEGAEGAEGAEGEGAEGEGAEGEEGEGEGADENEIMQQEIDNIDKNNTQSASYLPKLQILPRDPHMKNKLSKGFNEHINEVIEKTREASDSIAKQSKYIAEEQRIIDQKKIILDKRFIKNEKETNKMSWQMIKSLVATAGYLSDRFMSFIKYIFLFIIKTLHAAQPLLWALAAIICVFILILLISWLIRGGKFKLKTNDDTEEEEDTAEGKAECSTEYKQCGTSNSWDWNSCLKNPVIYTLSYNYNKASRELNMPGILGKLNDPLYRLRRTFKLVNFDRFKIPRNKTDRGRDDSISYINYDFIDDSISAKYFTSSDKKNPFNSLSLLKPQNIKWNLPHLDYINNTDMSKLPESIKNYKNQSDYSLNDTSTIIFPWTIVNDEYIIDCNTKFKNNIDTNLYISDMEDSTICNANENISATLFVE